jgi:hypothetical protein
MMTITFACPGCARRYSVNQALAGKRTKCKQCGHGMTIPAAAVEPAATGPAFDPYALDDEPAATTRVSAAVSESGLGYGLASSPGSRSAVAEAEAPAAAPRRVGPAKKKTAKARGGAGVMAGRGGAGLSLGGLVAVGVFALRLVAAGHGLFGLSGRSEVEQYAETNLAGVQEITSILGTVHDPASAGAATPRATAVLNHLVAEARRVKDKKARISDLDAVKQKYEGRMAAAKADLDRETQRVASVPGGMGVILALQGPAQELTALEASADGGPRPSGL